MNAGGSQTWIDAFEATRARLPGNGVATSLRESAIAQFREQGFPSPRHEDWLTTDLRPVTRASFTPAGAPTAAVLDEAAKRLETLMAPPEEAARLVFVDGAYAPSLSTAPTADGLEVTSLAEAMAKGGGRPAACFGTAAAARGGAMRSAFQALNTALWQDGAYVRVPRGVVLDAPIHLVFLAVASQASTSVHARLLVVAEAGSQASILETWTGVASAAGLHNALAEFWVEEDAKLELLEFQKQPAETLHFRAVHAHVARDSRFGATCLSFGGRLARNDVRVHLAAPGASCRLDGLSFAKGEQRVDHQTHIVHAQPHGSSRQLYKGILDDRSRVAFSGRVLVEQDAQQTDARQANHNVLLTKDAVADSKPQLEIFADDVKCAHGATVGQLDEDALFYLRTRGLDRQTATSLLLDAFAGEVPGRIEEDALRRFAMDALALHVAGAL